ncbi:MAG: hypothetical protein KA735_14230 [Burkholderiaceae bacterium]|nr:hypothetical protein [Burkholderiaceae bacterium]
MAASYKRNAFKPTAYGNSRRSRRVPRWLVLMLTGIILGSGGLLFLQKSYGPTRLTVEQSEQLHYDLNSANMDKQRLQAQLNQQTHELTELRANHEVITTSLEQEKEKSTRLTQDIQLLADAMPADPRGTSPGIRAATFKNVEGQLAYEILLMQDKDKSDRFNGQIELVVNGRYPNGNVVNIDLPRFDMALEQFTQVHGQVPLPNGLVARQVTIKVFKEGATKLSATRTIIVSK